MFFCNYSGCYRFRVTRLALFTFTRQHRVSSKLRCKNRMNSAFVQPLFHQFNREPLNFEPKQLPFVKHSNFRTHLIPISIYLVLQDFLIAAPNLCGCVGKQCTVLRHTVVLFQGNLLIFLDNFVYNYWTAFCTIVVHSDCATTVLLLIRSPLFCETDVYDVSAVLQEAVREF